MAEEPSSSMADEKKDEYIDEGWQLLEWAQSVLSDKYGLSIEDFGSSWRDGVAFNSLIHNLDPTLVDTAMIFKRKPRRNLEVAFGLAEEKLGIARTLTVEDVDMDQPDEIAIMKYVAHFAARDGELDDSVIEAILAQPPSEKRQQQQPQQPHQLQQKQEQRLPPTPPPSPPPPPLPPRPPRPAPSQNTAPPEQRPPSPPPPLPRKRLQPKDTETKDTEEPKRPDTRDKKSESCPHYLLFVVVAVAAVFVVATFVKFSSWTQS